MATRVATRAARVVLAELPAGRHASYAEGDGVAIFTVSRARCTGTRDINDNGGLRMMRKHWLMAVALTAVVVSACGESAIAPSDEVAVSTAFAKNGNDDGDVGTLGKAVPTVSCTYRISWNGEFNQYRFSLSGTWAGLRRVGLISFVGRNEISDPFAARIVSGQTNPEPTSATTGTFAISDVIMSGPPSNTISTPPASGSTLVAAGGVAVAVASGRNSYGPYPCTAACLSGGAGCTLP